jgi:hypothetical protein
VPSPSGLGFGGYTGGGFGGYTGGGGQHSMSPQSLGISGASEEDTHKLRLTVAEMRRDAALLEQRVRAAEVDDDVCTFIPSFCPFSLPCVFPYAACFSFSSRFAAKTSSLQPPRLASIFY